MCSVCTKTTNVLTGLADATAREGLLGPLVAPVEDLLADQQVFLDDLRLALHVWPGGGGHW